MSGIKWRGLLDTLVKVASIATMIGIAVVVLDYSLKAAQDHRHKSNQFHDLVREAELKYCETVEEGVPVQIKLVTDRAAKLEPEIRDDVVALEYITLASVGSTVWSHDRAHQYGELGLKLGISTGEPIEQYAANLLLGHIDFLRYRETEDKAFQSEARAHFRDADKLVSVENSRRMLHFAGQLYVLWGSHEMLSGEEEEAAIQLQRARDVWGKLPQKKARLDRIDYEERRARNGNGPRLPCPSLLTVSPPIFEKPERPIGGFETQVSASNDENAEDSINAQQGLSDIEDLKGEARQG